MAAPPITADVPLDDRLCLALYTASRAMTATYRPLLADLGLTYPQYLVLVLLMEDGPTSVGRIGSRLSLDSSTLSPLLKRLETGGLVTRTRSPQDERSVQIALTPAGEALRGRASEVHRAICASTGLSDAAAESLVAELHRLSGELQPG